MKSVIRAVLALTLLLSTVLVGASPAMAQEVLSGTVTVDGGRGLSNVQVEAFDADDDSFAGQGHYRFERRLRHRSDPRAITS